MAVRKFRNSWWIDIRHEQVRFRKRSPENSKTGAQAFEASIRHQLARGISFPDRRQLAQKQKFKDFALRWLNTYAKTNNKFSELERKRYALNKHLIPFFGETPLDKIDSELVELYKAKKLGAGDLANKTINNQLNVLGKCLATAQEWFDLPRMPRIRLLKLPPQKFDFLKPEESELLLAHTSGLWHEIVFTALQTGLRRGELKALDWSDINWERRLITVRSSWSEAGKALDTTKNNRERHIHLTNELYEMLLERKESGGPVFIENGRPFETTKLNAELANACRRAELRQISCHVLRHTFASHLVTKGASLKEIQELLGHESIQITMRYAHLDPRNLRRAIDLLERNSNNQIYSDVISIMGNREATDQI